LKELDSEDARKKNWRDCVQDDMESLVLFQKDAQFRNKWRRSIKGATGLTQVHLEKQCVYIYICVCVCVCVCVYKIWD